MKEKSKVVIIGGGITGLVLAWELLNKNMKTVVLEKEKSIGGLAKTFCYDNFKFDIGPHRFYTSYKNIQNYFLKILSSEDIVYLKRKSLIYCKGKIFNWPLTVSDIFKLNPWEVIDIFFSFLQAHFYVPLQSLDFKTYIIHNFGFWFYKFYFQPLTRKFLGLSPEHIHYKWAKEGIDKAVIEEKISSRNFWDLLRMILQRNTTQSTMFIYPVEGIGKFCEVLYQKIKKAGGEILTDVRIENLEINQDKIESVKTSHGVYHPSIVIWTGCLQDLAHLVGYKQLHLKYKDIIILVYLFPKKDVIREFQWCYFSDSDIAFHRLSMPHCFSSAMVPCGWVLIVAEVSLENENVNSLKIDKLEEIVLNDLRKISIVKRNASSAKTVVKRIKNAYPVYDLNFVEEKARFFKFLEKFKNLKLAGRLGLFWYNNMDEAIYNALAIVRNLKFK